MVSARFRARAGPPLGCRAKRSGYRRLRHAASNSEVPSSDPSSTTTTSKGRSCGRCRSNARRTRRRPSSPVEGGHHHRNQRRGHLRAFPARRHAPPPRASRTTSAAMAAARPRGIPRLFGRPRSAVGVEGLDHGGRQCVDVARRQERATIAVRRGDQLANAVDLGRDHAPPERQSGADGHRPGIDLRGAQHAVACGDDLSSPSDWEGQR